MKTVKTRPEITIPDDCNSCECAEAKTCCEHLTARDKKTFCAIYREYLEGHEAIKCDQCKADYLKAKRNEPVSSIVIDNYRYDCIEFQVYGNCGGRMAATLICNNKERIEFAKKFKEPNDFSVSTHDGLFNHIGMVMCVGMHHSESGKMCIEIMIMITR